MIRRILAAMALDAIAGLACLVAAIVLTPLLAFADSTGGPALPISGDLITSLVAGYGMPAIVLWAIACLVCSILCAVTPTPAPGSRWSALYELVELIAVNTRTAKSTGIPIVDALHAEQRAVLAAEAAKAAATPPAGTALVALFLAGSLLTACASGSPLPPVPTPSAADIALSSSAAGQNINSWLSGLNTNLQQAATTADGVVQASQPVLQNLLAVGGTLYTAYQIAAPLAGASAQDNQEASAAIATLNQLATSNPTNVAQAVLAAAGAAATLKDQLATVAPQTAAAVSLPPIAPAS